MRITTVTPPPPPREFVMTFTREEGWALVAALAMYADRHPLAVDREHWQEWAKDLDKVLRA